MQARLSTAVNLTRADAENQTCQIGQQPAPTHCFRPEPGHPATGEFDAKTLEGEGGPADVHGPYPEAVLEFSQSQQMDGAPSVQRCDTGERDAIGTPDLLSHLNSRQISVESALVRKHAKGTTIVVVGMGQVLGSAVTNSDDGPVFITLRLVELSGGRCLVAYGDSCDIGAYFQLHFGVDTPCESTITRILLEMQPCACAKALAEALHVGPLNDQLQGCNHFMTHYLHTNTASVS